MTVVLLAEDDAGISDPLSRALRRQGYDVQVAENGIDALRGARGSDLVVLDLGLPDLDGLDVCRTLRAEGSPVPVLSWRPEPPRLMRSLASTRGPTTTSPSPFALQN